MERFFEDYLERLHDLYQDLQKTFTGLPAEALDWIPGQEMNSFVVLVVHITGSVRYWVGDVALEEPSHRNRAAEFEAKGLSESELKDRLTASESYIRGALERLTLADLAALRMHRGGEVSAGWALLHALEHTGLHLGHAQITRQLWDQRQQ